MSWTPDEFNPGVTYRWRDKCQYYATWAFAKACRANCFYCFLRGHKGESRPWTDEQAVVAWRNTYEQLGPCSILLTGMEPTLELPLLGEVLKYHYGNLQTNMMFDVEELPKHCPPDRVDLHPTFHPHVWNMDIEPVLEKLRWLKGEGYHIELLASVGAPPYLRFWDEWAAAIKAEGYFPNFAMMRDTSWGGKMYPEGYTDEEREIMGRHIPWMAETPNGLAPLRLTGCAAGHAAWCIYPDGKVSRCSQKGHPLLAVQNMMLAGGVKLLEGPEPCEEECCRCGNFHGYHITEEAL
jgi:hypothetical protein